MTDSKIRTSRQARQERQGEKQAFAGLASLARILFILRGARRSGAGKSDPKQTNLIRCGVLGYSLIEVLIAAAILAFGIAAASMLGMSMVSQQEGSARVTRGLNCQEQACRLWQMGVPTNAIASILPPDAVISFSPTSLSNTGGGTVEYSICSAVITAGSLFGATSSQTNTMEIVRPSIR